MLSHAARARIWIASVVSSFVLLGCSSDDASPSISFSNTQALGEIPCETWSATLRDKNAYETAGCGSALAFEGVLMNQSYTFDVRGYASGKICWATTCRATTGGVESCQPVQSLCGL